MNQLIFFLLILVHSIFHVIRFVKEFQIGIPLQTKKSKYKPAAILWLSTAILFLLTEILYLMGIDAWFIIGSLALVTSQTMIIIYWHEMKWGTLPNLLIAVIMVFTYSNIKFEENYKLDIVEHIKDNNFQSSDILREKDLAGLPRSVQKYLRYAKVLNKPKIKNFRVRFAGKMRSRKNDFFSFSSEQYNIIDKPARLFFMKGKMYGFTFPAYHRYIGNTAKMDIRFYGLIPILSMSGPVMDKTETVTFFNDMCALAPATLIDKRITWVEINDTLTRAIFKNGNISISAELHFNENGQLINFISNDRTEINSMHQVPFSTPFSEYKKQNGYNLMSYGEAIWHYPEGNFIYGKFNLNDVRYNVKIDSVFIDPNQKMKYLKNLDF